MTNEEHIIYVENLRVALKMTNTFSAETMESLDEAIKALRQKSSDDCVSRTALKNKAIQLWNGGGDEDYKFSTLIDYITDLPPITLIQKWIPISVKPPKDKQRLFCYKSHSGLQTYCNYCNIFY